jgi:hypothetical protein
MRTNISKFRKGIQQPRLCTVDTEQLALRNKVGLGITLCCFQKDAIGIYKRMYDTKVEALVVMWGNSK